MKDKEHKKELLPLALLQQLNIRSGDPFQELLHSGKRAQTCLNLFLQPRRNGDLAHPPIPQTDGENPDRPVPLSFSLLAILTAGLITTHHSAEQRSGQDGAEIGQLLNELFTSSSEFSAFVFHLYDMKDKRSRATAQEQKQQNNP
jgi:hypothetical protein